MQEGRGDQLDRRLGPFCEVRRLQRVLELGYTLTGVLDVAVVAEELLDVGDAQAHGDVT
jgi:hypothetical protein